MNGKAHQLNKDLVEAFEIIKAQEDALAKEKSLKERQQKFEKILLIRGREVWEGDLMKMRKGRF